FVPTIADAGPVLIAARSALGLVLVVAVAVVLVRLASGVVLVTVAVLVTVPVVAAGTVTTSWKMSCSTAGRVVAVAALPATAKAVAPLVLVNDTKVVPAGMVSVTATVWALDGPLLVSVTVYVMLPAAPGVTDAGPVLVTA